MLNETRNEIYPALAAIFDMNGVVIDDLEYHLRSWQVLAKNHGATLTRKDFFQDLNGRTAPDTIPRIFNRPVSQAEVLLFSKEKERLYRQLYGPHRKLLSGLRQLLVSFQRLKIPCAVATSAPPENVGFILDYLKIRKYFTVVVDERGVKKGKPDPEIFLKAARQLGVERNRCVVFEDALLGVKAGKRAGMKVVGVTTTHPRRELGQADLIVKDFRSLTAEKMLKLFFGA